MKTRLVVTLGVALALVAARRSEAQGSVRDSVGGDVGRAGTRAQLTRLTTHIAAVDATLRARVRVSGDSAQRVAMNDFGWRGRVHSVEVDEQDGRVFWDVKVVPDTSGRTIIRYRIDATGGGILSIAEFGGIRGLARRPDRTP